MAALILIDASSDSLTVSWPEVPGAAKYILQYRSADDKKDSFETLSDKLTTPQARKRNLSNPSGFFFRAGVLRNGESSELLPTEWITHSEPFHLLSKQAEQERMAEPNVLLGGSMSSLRISWSAVSVSDSYELEMRENGPGVGWTTIATSFKCTEVRKKNLTSNLGYQFRVRPTGATATIAPFSTPSDPVVALGFSDGLQRLFGSLENGTLLKSTRSPAIPVAEALGGKEFVLLYASAHWCGPCRQFTPKLIHWYRQMGPNSTIEVVFLSADHDKGSFEKYYATMPWLVVDYDDDAREQLMGHIRVTGIPLLAVLDGRTGRIILDNAVGKPLDIQQWRTLAASNK